MPCDLWVTMKVHSPSSWVASLRLSTAWNRGHPVSKGEQRKKCTVFKLIFLLIFRNLNVSLLNRSVTYSYVIIRLREVAQQLQRHNRVVKISSWIPSSYTRWLTTTCNSSSRPSGSPCTHMYTSHKIHINTYNFKNYKCLKRDNGYIDHPLVRL